MKRQLTRSLILVLFALAAFACAKKAAPAPATSTQAPALPADVQNVAAAASTAAPTAAEGGGASEGASAAQSAIETGGTIVATGEFISPVRSELAAKLPGRVGKLYVDEGAHVQKGQPLLELETDYTRLNLQRAAADAQRAAAAEQDAARDLDRKKELIAKQSIPQATFDRTQSVYDQAKAAHASADAQVAMYKQQLSDSVLRSPID